jgi:hypothetical protein
MEMEKCTYKVIQEIGGEGIKKNDNGGKFNYDIL